jgi:predicted nuclease of predicted toxin-antitoxin system
VRIWVDAQLSPALARWLRDELAVDAVAVRELGLQAAEDPEIFARARSQDGTVVLTKDSDFVELVTRLGPPPQIVWLTCGNTSTAYLRDVFRESWLRVESLLAAGEALVEIGGRST